MMDEGVIKFQCDWQKGQGPGEDEITDLNTWRSRLFDLGLIGVYEEEEIGFGNISVRTKSGCFLISATQTGHIARLGVEHYTYVLEYDIEKNFLKCVGQSKASSESLTHAMIYELSSDIEAIVHVHNNNLWQTLKGKLPTTSADVPYGTPAMAKEVQRLYSETDLPKKKIFVMAGHEDGIISFGKTCAEATETLLAYRE